MSKVDVKRDKAFESSKKAESVEQIRDYAQDRATIFAKFDELESDNQDLKLENQSLRDEIRDLRDKLDGRRDNGIHHRLGDAVEGVDLRCRTLGKKVDNLNGWCERLSENDKRFESRADNYPVRIRRIYQIAAEFYRSRSQLEETIIRKCLEAQDARHSDIKEELKETVTRLEKKIEESTLYQNKLLDSDEYKKLNAKVANQWDAIQQLDEILREREDIKAAPKTSASADRWIHIDEILNQRDAVISTKNLADILTHRYSDPISPETLNKFLNDFHKGKYSYRPIEGEGKTKYFGFLGMSWRHQSKRRAPTRKSIEENDQEKKAVLKRLSDQRRSIPNSRIPDSGYSEGFSRSDM